MSRRDVGRSVQDCDAVKPDVLVDGLAFGEGPRWRDGRLWFCDVHAGEVATVDMEGRRENVAAIDGAPAGLGWLPDGTLLVTRGRPAAVMAVTTDGVVSEYVDLTPVTAFLPNDMVVDTDGRAWVGACDIGGTAMPALSQLLRIDTDRSVSVVDAALRFPNGAVVTGDGHTLIVAETLGSGMTAFTLGSDGRATGKRTWALVPGSFPDGICLDAEGAVWFADPIARAAIRVREHGEVIGRVETDLGCFACTLGGADGRTLFLVTGELAEPETARTSRRGRIETVAVEVPGSGSP
jgi:sugar lactone lactonase YvrE